MTVTEFALTSCVWTHILKGSHTMPRQRHSQPTPTLLGHRCMCLGVTCHLHFWQNDQGLLCATAVTQGWNGHWIRVSTQSWLEKKILPQLLPGFEFVTFWSRVRCSNQQLYKLSIVHTAFRKCLWLVQNIYWKWLTHHFRHSSNSTKGVLALLLEQQPLHTEL